MEAGKGKVTTIGTLPWSAVTPILNNGQSTRDRLIFSACSTFFQSILCFNSLLNLVFWFWTMSCILRIQYSDVM